MPAPPYPIQQSRRSLTFIAWVVVILVSALPDIAWAELAGYIPAYMTFARLGLLLVLILASLVWKLLRPLRNFFIALAAFFGFSELRGWVDFTIPALQALFGSSVFDARMQAEQTGKLVVSLAMIVTLLVSGYNRHNFFLARGDLRTPIVPVPLLGFPKPDPWPRFALQWGIYIAAALAVLQYFGLRPVGADLLRIGLVLPSILFYAALNAFNEEVTYRAPMLATLERVGGSQQALWMAAYFFGISHYFGTPGGVLGGIASIFMGWILTKAMLETRGLFWSWWIHFLSDIAIFVFLTLTLVR